MEGCASDIFSTSVWCILEFGAEAKALLLWCFCLFVQFLALEGKTKPCRTSVHTKGQLKGFPSASVRPHCDLLLGLIATHRGVSPNEATGKQLSMTLRDQLTAFFRSLSAAAEALVSQEVLTDSLLVEGVKSRCQDQRMPWRGTQEGAGGGGGKPH